MFIRVTHEDGEYEFVNVDFIIRIVSREGGSFLMMAHGPSGVMEQQVTETPEELSLRIANMSRE